MPIENTPVLRAAPAADRGIFRQVFREMPCGALSILEKSPAPDVFTYIDSNIRFARLFGMSPEEVAGKTVLDLLPNARSCGLIDLLNEVHRSGDTRQRPILIFDNGEIAG